MLVKFKKEGSLIKFCSIAKLNFLMQNTNFRSKKIDRCYLKTYNIVINFF